MLSSKCNGWLFNVERCGLLCKRLASMKTNWVNMNQPINLNVFKAIQHADKKEHECRSVSGAVLFSGNSSFAPKKLSENKRKQL